MSLIRSAKNAVTPGGRHGVSRRESRDAIGHAVSALNTFAQSNLIDRLGMRKTSEQAVYQATKSGFKAAGAAGRTFSRSGSGEKQGARVPGAPKKGVFDLTPTEDEQSLVEVVADFATEALRPAAAEANETCEAPDEILRSSLEMGLPILGVPEDLGGIFGERSAMGATLVHEALAKGDMGLALAVLAPGAVSTAISLWGTEEQQQTYLPAFTGDAVPSAALALSEPTVLFDPLKPGTKATRDGSGYVLSGVKSAVVRGATAELFIVGAELEGKPALFIVESSAEGVRVEADPSMGVRAAGLTRLHLTGVRVGSESLLGETDGTTYVEAVRLARLGWCALAIGTGQAVLDYVTDYVKTREAFGEPISHRQAVAFMVANIAIELQGMRLVTYRAASRAARGEDFAREVALARRICTDKGMQIGLDGVQLLGGHGFVKEHPVERWYRDLRAVGVMEGGVLV
ncbi:MAG: acyl-CoA dehydrogenase [Marmoricola sp.]|nr:acyl-CoA dehydrogenase [Marmoricola sp.]